MNEQREHPRIELPLLVELAHVSIEKTMTTARDISDGGIFLNLAASSLAVGAEVGLTIQPDSYTAPQATPTINAQVVRVENDGIALAFKNKTAEHLWSSVERTRTQLKVGEDLFQVFEAMAITHTSRGLLLLQQNGKWTFPGFHLTTATANSDRMKFCQEALGLTCLDQTEPVFAEVFRSQLSPEATTYCTVIKLSTSDIKPELGKQEAYRDWRWVGNIGDLNDLTMAYDWMRIVATSVINSLAAENLND